MWTPFAQQSPHTKGSITFPFLPGSISINKMLVRSILCTTISINSSFWKANTVTRKMHVLHRCLWMTELTKKKIEVICTGEQPAKNDDWKQIPPFLCFVEPSHGPRLSWKYFDSKYFHHYLADCYLLALGKRKHASARDCRPCCAAWPSFPKRDPLF